MLFNFEGTAFKERKGKSSYLNKRIEKSGDYSEEATPVPIPNTEVKLLSAEDTWRAASWEIRTSPVFSLYGPMVKRLRHRPFTAVTRVRFPVGSPLEGNQTISLFLLNM